MDGEPVPWLTYPASFWLKAVCDGVDPVFEFGCGNSTLWWAKRSRRVVAVEYDAGWLGRIMEAKLSNVQVHRTPIESYSEALATSSERFEVIVIDGGSDKTPAFLQRSTTSQKVDSSCSTTPIFPITLKASDFFIGPDSAASISWGRAQAPASSKLRPSSRMT